jgi:hypothetical protein
VVTLLPELSWKEGEESGSATREENSEECVLGSSM